MQKSFGFPLVLVFLFLAPTLGLSAASGGELCARTPQEVAASPVLKSTLKTFGGASSVFGSWKLAGFASLFAKVTVTLTATPDAFSVQVDDTEPNDFWLCVDSAAPDVFRMRVQNPRKPENALFLLKAREPGRTVLVASEKSRWKFMKFKRPSEG